MNTKLVKDITFRMTAMFVMSAVGVISGAAVFAPEVSVLKAALLAGCGACVQVIQRLASAAVDGSLSADEVAKAFGSTKNAGE